MPLFSSVIFLAVNDVPKYAFVALTTKRFRGVFTFTSPLILGTNRLNCAVFWAVTANVKLSCKTSKNLYLTITYVRSNFASP